MEGCFALKIVVRKVNWIENNRFPILSIYNNSKVVHFSLHASWMHKKMVSNSICKNFKMANRLQDEYKTTQQMVGKAVLAHAITYPLELTCFCYYFSCYRSICDQTKCKRTEFSFSWLEKHFTARLHRLIHTWD